MCDASDADYFLSVIDDVDDSVISDADAPEVLITTQFLTSGRPWIGG